MIIPALLLSLTLNYGTAYCWGYQAGWSRGYCDGKANCSAPIPPSCPAPRGIEKSWEEGYVRGAIDGAKASK